MLSYTKYPKLDFTWFISEGETPIENWLQTVAGYRKKGVSTFELYDLRPQTNLFSVEQIEMILHYTHNSESSRPSNGKTALIVDDGIKFGIARMYEMQAECMTEEWSVEVFDEMKTGSLWLGNAIAQFVSDTIADPS